MYCIPFLPNERQHQLHHLSPTLSYVLLYYSLQKLQFKDYKFVSSIVCTVLSILFILIKELTVLFHNSLSLICRLKILLLKRSKKCMFHHFCTNHFPTYYPKMDFAKPWKRVQKERRGKIMDEKQTNNMFFNLYKLP